MLGRYNIYQGNNVISSTKMLSRRQNANRFAMQAPVEYIPSGKRPATTVNDGLTREEFATSLLSPNPLRTNITYTQEQLFFMEIPLKYALNSGHVRIFNETMEGIADFYTKAIKHEKIPSKNPHGRVIIQVKYVEAGKSVYMDKSIHFPHKFIKNKGISQVLVFRQVVSNTEITDIITVPFMFGTKWCATAGMTPGELHMSGENALNYRGFFIIDGTPRFTVAHEKIAHNAITTVFDEGKKAFVTSLKIQDERNNSVEYRLYKGIKTRGSAKKEEENTYFLSSGCFNQPFEANRIFKQIYVLLSRLRGRDETLEPLDDYDDYMSNLARIVAGPRLRHYILYEWNEESMIPIAPPDTATTLSKAMDIIYKKERKNTYEQLNPNLTSIDDYPEMVINSIFPSIHTTATRTDNGPQTTSNRSRYNTLQSKAMLLMRMMVANLLTEQGVTMPTNRNNVANKAYLTAAEIIRRDLTRDEGSYLRKSRKSADDRTTITDYRPKSSVAKGEANVLEVLDFSNMYEVFSCLCILSIPRCAHSRDQEIRGVNESHTGYVCPYDTPSNELVGLITHTALTAMFSVQKNVSMVYVIIDDILERNHIRRKFDVSPEARSSNIETKLLSINSVPYSLITVEVFEQIRNRFKRDYRFMDTLIIEESYEVRSSDGKKEVYIASYNLLCDSGRIHRPLYNVKVLRERNLVDDDAINAYLKSKTLEEAIADGVLEMVFPAEVEFYRIATKRSDLLTAEAAPDEPTPVRYCELDELALFGMVASCAPMINHAPGNRGMHEPPMAKSAITPVSTNIEMLSEASSKVLHSAQAAPVTTRLNEVYSRDIANGTCAVMAIAITETNLEDAYEACETWARNIITERITTIEINVEREDNQGIPAENDYRMDRYHDMDHHTGLPKIGEYRKVGDAIFAKYRYETIAVQQSGAADSAVEEATHQIVNKSEFIEIGKDGYVQKISEFVLEKTRVFRITIASVRTVETGNKIATRYSQKGVIGGIVPASQMPPIATGKRKGLKPDLIFSPMSLTSRATPAVILELLLGNYAVATGKQVDASAFSMTKERLIQYNKELEELGYEPWGIETYEHPVTKQRFQMMTGVAYVRILKHTAFEKQKACGFVNVASIDKITRQPSKGGPKAPVKIGFMDRNVMAAHSCANIITAMMRDQSDKVLVELCSICGHLNDRCNRDPETVVDVYASTHCTKCGEQSLVTTKVPWAMVGIYFSLLSIGVKYNQWPGVE